MAGTKRHPIHRPSWYPAFTAEALQLFAELEHTPRRRRGNQAFEDKAHELARMLNLVPEWWTGNSVLDDSSEPVHPEDYVSREDWFRVRAVREALLLAIAQHAA